MITIKFREGERVTYKTPYKTKNGIVKCVIDEDHTAARTKNSDLIHGWE